MPKILLPLPVKVPIVFPILPHSLKLVLGIYALGACFLNLPAAVLYVKEGNQGAAAPYSSWDTASSNLQDALSAAESGDQVWVAEGVYYPDRGDGQATGDRSATFQLVSGVEVYGGFPSDGSVDTLEGRQLGVCRSVLSGDLAGDDASGFVARDDNSYHVLTAKGGVGLDTVLEGFDIRGGNADGEGEDIYGGGLYCDNGSPLIRNCRFLSNESSVQGGALALQFGSNAVFVNCEFRGNRSGFNGGVGMIVFCKGSFLNCLFSGNEASQYGGVINNSAGFSDFINCTFSGNRAGKLGGVFYNNAGSSRAYNSIFWGNGAAEASTPAEATYLDDFEEDVPFFENCVVEDLAESFLNSGFGDNNFSGLLDYQAPKFVSEIDWSSAPTEAGDYRLGNDSGVLDRGTPDAQFGLSGARDAVSAVSTDLAGNERVTNNRVDLGAYESDNTAPRVLRVLLDDHGPLNTTTLDYAMSFTEAVTGVEILDAFELDTSGTVNTGALSVEYVEESGAYRISISDISGDGTVAIRLKEEGSIRSLSGHQLTRSPRLDAVTVYDIPTVAAVELVGDDPTSSTDIVYRVQFSEAVDGFSDQSDLSVLLGENVAVGRIQIVDLVDAGKYEVLLSDVVGDGDVELFVSDFGGITDLAGYAFEGPERLGAFVVDQTEPVLTVEGDSVVLLEVDSDWSDPGATVVDNLDDGVVVVVTGDSVDTDAAGSYEIVYTATDHAGNAVVQKRLVVVGTPKPVQQWALDNGVSLLLLKNEVDLGRDLTYLERYAYGLSVEATEVPLEFENDVPTRVGSPVFRHADGSGEDLLHFYYLSRVDAEDAGLLYRIQSSEDLVSWSLDESLVPETLGVLGDLELNRVSLPRMAGFKRLAIKQEY